FPQQRFQPTQIQAQPADAGARQARLGPTRPAVGAVSVFAHAGFPIPLKSNGGPEGGQAAGRGEEGNRKVSGAGTAGRTRGRCTPSPLPLFPSSGTLMNMTPQSVAEIPRLAPRDPDANKGDFG